MQNISGVHAFEIRHFNRIIVPVKKALISFIDAEDIEEIIYANPKLALAKKYWIIVRDMEKEYCNVERNPRHSSSLLKK